MTTWQEFGIVTLKLAFTGATVAAIAFAFGVLDSGGTVAESEADIIALDWGTASNHEKMSKSMEHLGHPDPWPLNINGNVVYFSTKSYRAEPRMVANDYLRTFYERGLNRANYADEDEDTFAESYPLDALNGGAVPLVMEEDHVVLGGVQSTREAKSPEDLKVALEDHLKDPQERWYEAFKGFRHVELNRTGPETQVTSVWSDDDFDYEKMQVGGQAVDVNTSSEFPSCPGCVRLNSTESLERKRPYSSAVYLGGNKSLEDVRNFYVRSLGARGWEPTEAADTMEKVRDHVEFEGKHEAQMLQFARGGQFMTVLVHARDDQFVANLSITD